MASRKHFRDLLYLFERSQAAYNGTRSAIRARCRRERWTRRRHWCVGYVQAFGVSWTRRGGAVVALGRVNNRRHPSKGRRCRCISSERRRPPPVFQQSCSVEMDLRYRRRCGPSDILVGRGGSVQVGPMKLETVPFIRGGNCQTSVCEPVLLQKDRRGCAAILPPFNAPAFCARQHRTGGHHKHMDFDHTFFSLLLKGLRI